MLLYNVIWNLLTVLSKWFGAISGSKTQLILLYKKEFSTHIYVKLSVCVTLTYVQLHCICYLMFIIERHLVHTYMLVLSLTCMITNQLANNKHFLTSRKYCRCLGY